MGSTSLSGAVKRTDGTTLRSLAEKEREEGEIELKLGKEREGAEKNTVGRVDVGEKMAGKVRCAWTMKNRRFYT